jgi:uncharacterized protein (DUF736 family)
MNNTQQNNNNKKDELGALWKKKSKSGMSFLSGYVKVDDLGLEKEIKVVVFANTNKSNEKAPDYRIYVSKPLELNSQVKPEALKLETPKQEIDKSQNVKVKSKVLSSSESDNEDIL